ncbi:MAG TPA: hypothetical protein VNL77_02920 [Roseiflexaceae bacterium]|nr:hypothetical protein [Roseiflexaceae bacterium]
MLPIDKCSRRIAPRMQKDGYDVRSIEFAGPHTVPQGLFEKPPGWGARGPQAPSRSPFQTGSQDIRQQAVEWLIGG